MKTLNCHACGASMKEHRHGLTEPLVQCLLALADAGDGPVGLKELRLSHNRWCNFQKLRYFGLVQRCYRNGKRLRGHWQITAKGRKFVQGKLACADAAWTFRGETIRLSTSRLKVHQVHGGYETYEDFAAAVRAH